MTNRQENDADMVAPWGLGRWAIEVAGWIITILVIGGLIWLSGI